METHIQPRVHGTGDGEEVYTSRTPSNELVSCEAVRSALQEGRHRLTSTSDSDLRLGSTVVGIGARFEMNLGV